MTEPNHQAQLQTQLFQLILWALAINAFTHVLRILRKPEELNANAEEEDALVHWIWRAAVFALVAAGFAVRSGDLSVLVLAVGVLGPLVVLR